MATYWALAASSGTLSSNPLPSPTKFKWNLPNKKRLISGVEVDFGKPSVEFTWNALRPDTYRTLAAKYVASSPTVYFIIPVENNLLATESGGSTNIGWGIFSGVMSRPSYDQLHTGAAMTGWRENVTLRLTQVTYQSVYTP